MSATGATESLTRERERELQLLVIIARSLADLTSKLSDLNTLSQQQVDLLRRIVSQQKRTR
jgi:hypothetical protein